MTIPLKVKSATTRNYPQNKDKGYGVEATAWASDVTAALNATPTTNSTFQVDYILGSAVQVTAGLATHSSLAAILAASSDGDMVYVLTGTYQYPSKLDITKRLTIINQSSDSIHESTAAIVTGAILKFSTDGSSFIGGKVVGTAGSPGYCIEIDAEQVEVNTQTGGWSIDEILFTSGLATFTGAVRDPSEGILYGTPNGGADVALSNLAGVAINRSLVSDSNMVDNLGSDPKEWLTVYCKNLAHDDAGFPDLAILTSGNNGKITLTPHGTGTTEINKGNYIGGSIGQTTPVTAVTVDNITLNGDLISDSTNDLTLQAVAANKDVILKTESTGRAKADIGGTEYNLPYVVAIQDYTAVGAIGAALQQNMGVDFSVAELENFFGAGTVKAYYRFGAGAALGTDETATYNLTLGAVAAAPSNTTGFLNTNFGISFDGGDYAYQNGVLLDDLATQFPNGFTHFFCMEAPTDGVPAAQSFLFFKRNSAANDSYTITLESSGFLSVNTRGNSASTISLMHNVTMPNGANTKYYFCVVTWNPTTGLALYVNGNMSDSATNATTLMVNGSTTDLYIGANSAPANYYTGKIMNCAFINAAPTPRQIELLFSTKVAEPAILASKNYTIESFRKPNNVTAFAEQSKVKEICRYNGNIYLSGGTRSAEDYYLLQGVVK